jgi:hypothetical protein
MCTLLPILRSMWYTAVPSASCSPSSLEKATMVIGTHSRPTPRPCSAMGQNTSCTPNPGSSCDSCQPASACSRKPKPIIQRGSNRLA